MKNFKIFLEENISVICVVFSALLGSITFLLPIHIMHYHNFIGGIVLFFILLTVWLFGMDEIESKIKWEDEEDEFYED